MGSDGSLDRDASRRADLNHPPVNYYGLPLLKRPHWKWEIALYFWIGGIAAGASLIAAIAELLGDARDRPVVRAGRLIALPLLLLSPLLLIKDLGRPGKFMTMLRVVKLKSPMSVGAWGLLSFGGISGLAALLELCPARQRLDRLSRLLAMVSAPFSLLIGGYTGVLISATAVPLWAKNRLLWGPAFLASAFSTGVAAVSGALALTGSAEPSTLRKLERAHRLGLVAEAGLIGISLLRLGTAGRVLTTGKWSSLFLPGVFGLGLGLPLLLGARASRRAPTRARVALRSVCILLGGLALRTCIVYAGKDSADDPQAYFELTTG